MGDTLTPEVHCSGSGLRPVKGSEGRIGGSCPTCDGWYPINDYGVIPPHKRSADGPVS